MKPLLQVTNEDGSIKGWPATQITGWLLTTQPMSRVDFVGGSSQQLPTQAVADFLEIAAPVAEAVAGTITPIGDPEPIGNAHYAHRMMTAKEGNAPPPNKKNQRA